MPVTTSAAHRSKTRVDELTLVQKGNAAAKANKQVHPGCNACSGPAAGSIPLCGFLQNGWKNASMTL